MIKKGKQTKQPLSLSKKREMIKRKKEKKATTVII